MNLYVHRLGLTALAAAFAIGVSGCGGDAGETVRQTRTDTLGGPAGEGYSVATVYSPNLGIDLGAMRPLPSGLYLRDLEPGAGDTAVAGNRVLVDYTGWLPNGVEFDASNGNPIAFTLGVGEVIPGWDQGIAGMRAGGRRVLVIPPALAYGEPGRPGVIPPSSTLVFDVRLIEIMADSAAATSDTSATAHE